MPVEIDALDPDGIHNPAVGQPARGPIEPWTSGPSNLS
jgi:hypothetical protein